jgi:hypothetical protein
MVMPIKGFMHIPPHIAMTINEDSYSIFKEACQCEILI